MDLLFLHIPIMIDKNIALLDGLRDSIIRLTNATRSDMENKNPPPFSIRKSVK